MKNLLHNIQILMMLAIMVVGIQSCSDDLHDVGDVEVNFTAMLPTDTRTRSFKSRKTKRDGCEKRNAFIETKTKCASNLIRKVTAYLQNQSKTPSLYIKINGIQMDF